MSDPTSKSQSQMRTLVTEDFRDSHERIFGDRKPSRGRWVWDKVRKELVPEAEYVPPHDDSRVMVVTDRHMEGEHTIEGVDIGSRAKRREHMRRNGLADASDFTQAWADKPKVQRRNEEREIARLTEQVGRTAYELSTQKGRKR